MNNFTKNSKMLYFVLHDEFCLQVFYMLTQFSNITWGKNKKKRSEIKTPYIDVM